MTEYLPIGYRLKLNSRSGEYIITKVIGQGASTIAYLTDYVNQSGMHSERILKEFYPNYLDISRSDDGALLCVEKDLEKFAQRKARFVEGGDRQNSLRQRTRLKNETLPLQEILDANNTKYLEVTSFEGKTLDHIEDFSIVERIKLCLTVAKLVSRYHAEGFLCLDIKPENIFVLANGPDEVVTDMVEFIDFDSVIEKDKIAFGNALSYTSNWAAPEQINPYGYKKISEVTDIYAVGELVFWIMFGRHSTSEEHRSFSEYPFETTDAPFAKVLSRRAVQKLLTKLFRHTLRSSVHNRFATMDKVIDLLQKLTAEVEKKEFILDYKIRPKAFFIGRDRELAEIDAALQEHSVVFVSGIAGIGKSELVKQYACSHVDAYDNILYWTYEGNLDSMVASDASVAISNFSRIQEESDFQYAKRKIEKLHELLNGHKNLMVIDNLDILVEELPQQETWQLLKNLPCQILITTRCAENLYKTLNISPLADAGDLVLLFKQVCPFNDGETDAVEQIIQSVGGDTLLVELLAHHTKAVHAYPRQTLDKLHSSGIGGLSGGAVRLLKDDRVTTDTVFSHIEKIFSMDAMSEPQVLLLAMLALLPMDGVSTSKFAAFYSIENYDDLNWLIHHGWVTVSAGNDEQIALHPTIASFVMEYIKAHKDLPKLLYPRCYDAIQVRRLAEVDQKSFAEALALSTTDRFAVKCRAAAIFTEQYVNLYSKYGNAEKKLEQINYAIEILQSELPENKYSGMLAQCNYLKARRLFDLGQYEDALAICLEQLRYAKAAKDINFTAIWYFQLSCLYELIPHPNYVKQFWSYQWGTCFMVKLLNDIERRNPHFLDIQRLKENMDYDYLARTKKQFYFNMVIHFATVLESQSDSDLAFSKPSWMGHINLQNAIKWRKQLAHKYKWSNKANEAEIEIDKAKIAFLSQNYREAEALLTKLVAFQTEQYLEDTFTSYRIHQLLGQIMLRSEPVDYEKAIAEFERCMEISENLVSHNTYTERLELAYLYIVCGKRKEAIAMNIESFNEVKRLPTEIRKTFYADALRNMGYFYYANGIHARSRDYLEMALQKYDKSVAPYEMIQFGKARTKSHLAEWYLSNNCAPGEVSTEEAVNYLQSAVECYKSSVGLDHPEAKACLKRLKEIRQQS